MSNLVAKPIVKNQLWVITDGVNKIGNIEANSNGYNVKIGSSSHTFSTTKSIEKTVHLVFEKPEAKKKTVELPFAHWPTSGKTYNNFFDVKRKIHVYTKTPDSKCYYAAGYFNININGQPQTQFCPKYIFIQRYSFNGPYNSKSEAQRELNKLL
jgi:hypothetical protein